MIGRVVGHSDVATTSAQEPLSFAPPHHGFEIAALYAVWTTHDFGQGGSPSSRGNDLTQIVNKAQYGNNLISAPKARLAPIGVIVAFVKCHVRIELRAMKGGEDVRDSKGQPLQPEAAEGGAGGYVRDGRHFGLFAPRALSQTSAAIFVILRQKRRPRPKPRPWARSIERDFGYDPLVDNRGKRMKWVGRVAPKAPL
jgi:hypothetical protein